MNTKGAGSGDGGRSVSIGGDAQAIATDLAGGTRIVVEPDQVLAAAKVVTEQADALSDALLRYGPTMRVGAPSENAVSTALADAWNSAVVDGDDAHLARAQEYLKGLRQLQQQLRQAAERYQLDDDETAAVFGDRRAR
ncbi:MAG: PE domain-containing protein [Thermocrispum sp.]